MSKMRIQEFGLTIVVSIAVYLIVGMLLQWGASFGWYSLPWLPDRPHLIAIGAAWGFIAYAAWWIIVVSDWPNILFGEENDSLEKLDTAAMFVIVLMPVLAVGFAGYVVWLLGKGLVWDFPVYLLEMRREKKRLQAMTPKPV